MEAPLTDPRSSSARTIVVGHRGQDGTLLCSLLRARGETLIGLGRDGVELISEGQQPLPPASVTDAPSIDTLLQRFAPTRIYYLAAHHSSSERHEPTPSPAADHDAADQVNLQGPIRFLDAMCRWAPRCRFFYASSSLIFGECTANDIQDESTPPTPQSGYALLKAQAQHACRRYREDHGLFASVGVLYNHESAFRPKTFLSRKVIDAALEIRAGSAEQLTLGSLDAAADWGYAPDFVDAFTRILDLDRPDDFIVATGTAHTVRQFVTVAFAHVGLDWRPHARVDPTLLSRPPSCRIGNPAKLARLTGWAPSLGFEDMVRRLVDDAAEQRRGPHPASA